MSEFITRPTRVGPVHSYPDNPRAAALALFARNFATGPKTTTEISGDTLIPWNAIDTTAKPFGIAAGGVTVAIPGDVTALFSNGNSLNILPLVPDVLPVVVRSIVSVPVFAAGVTTFDLSGAIDGSTVGGTLENASTPTVNVPITPRTTGVVLITGVVGFINGSGSSVNVSVTVEVNGTAVPVVISHDAVEDGTETTVPFMVEVFLPVGTPSQIQVSVTGDNADLITDGSALNIQEVSVATG